MQILGAERLAQRLRSLEVAHPRVVVGGNFSTPWELLTIADRVWPRYRLFALNAQAGWPTREGVTTVTPFVGPGVRGHDSLEYLPMRLSLVPRLFATTFAPDVVMVQVTAPLRGRVSLGVEVNILPAALRAVQRRGGLVVAQINRHLPYTFGDAEIDEDAIDFALEAPTPLVAPSRKVGDDVHASIGERVATLVEDGATLQMGIGAIPDAVLSALGARRGLGIWSEMISDGVMQLDRTGHLDAQRPIVTTFAFGSPDLYRWLDGNRRVVFRRTELVNNPARIADQPRMVSINTAVEVDLRAQANASYVRGRIYSGFGGQPDFVAGSLHSSGGQAVLALRSWHDAGASSTIVAQLTCPVCSFQHSSVVTDQGTAHLWGRSQREQASALIESAADPRARAELGEAAERLGLR